MSAFVLKLIALVTMLIDHVGYLFFPHAPLLRFIGRCAFPIYCFLLVEGFFHTRRFSAYLGRMLIFSAVSEVCYDLAFSGTAVDWSDQNVFFTLSLGLVALWCVDHIDASLTPRSLPLSALAQLAALIAVGMAAWAIGSDYDCIGILYVAAFWYARRLREGHPALSRALPWLVFTLVFLYMPFRYRAISGVAAYVGWMERLFWIYAGTFLPLALVERYNGQRGPDSRPLQWGFYLFYPVHLLILAGIKIAVLP